MLAISTRFPNKYRIKSVSMSVEHGGETGAGFLTTCIIVKAVGLVKATEGVSRDREEKRS